MAQVEIKFLTRQRRFAIPDIPYVVSGTVTSKELSSLVKSVLKDSQFSNLEFEFLVLGELLRLPLKEHLEAKGVTEETSVDIEYFLKYPTPSPHLSLGHDDWVSSVKVKDEWILSGCYDNTIHIWNTAGEHKLIIPGHLSPIKSVAWIEVGSPLSSFVSTSHDETAMLWQWNQKTNAIECVHIYKGHSRSVDCVDINKTEQKFATGSYDQTLKVWPLDLTPEVEESVGISDRKKLKTSDGKSKVKTPLLTLGGHAEGISGIQWTDTNEICTSSLDSTLRIWDVELGGLKWHLNGSKAFFDVSYSPISHLLVTASSDRHVRLWDLRSKEGELVKSVFSSHAGWVSTVKWSPSQEHQFVSGSYDHQVKLWDIRSPKAPLYDMSGHEDKVLAVDWSLENYIVSGGADNHVKVYRIQGEPCDQE